MIGGPSLPFDRQAGKQASAVAAWVAVALATAIRLFAPAFVVATIVAVAALAIVAILAGRSRAVRVVALLLGVVALNNAATLIVLRVERAQFPIRSRMHLDR